VLDYKKPEFYLKNLPLTDSLLIFSSDKIANAILNAGKAYSERIRDTLKATETFELLINRFPDSELVPEAFYNLYKINRKNNISKSEAYRQRLLEKYPESEYAKILSDPAYYDKKMADMKMAEKLYQEAYIEYTGERFNEAINHCDDALKKYAKDLLAPKFLLLRAYSVARISDERGFKDELSALIKAWPGTVESKKAEEIVSFLNLKIPELKVEEDKQIATELFLADTTEMHSFVLIISDPSFNINMATFDVISYNIDNYTNNNFRTEGLLVDNKYIMITVSGFSDYSRAFGYYKAFTSEKIIRNSAAAKMMTFVINSSNLKVLNSDKNPGRYLLFFNEKYLK
jgi:tetratricopeptide (TPR) repeat protein